MKNLGVLGGRFDPIHTGHLIHARLVLETFGMDKILFVPAARPPHKEVHAAFADRARMVELAIEGEENFEISRIEWKEDLSYTVDTLTRLQSIYPDHRLFLIIGRDEYDCLDTWKEPRRIMKIAELVVLPRGIKWVGAPQPRIHLPDFPLLDISSSLIRGRITDSRPIRNFVPSAVERYINDKGLYKESS